MALETILWQTEDNVWIMGRGESQSEQRIFCELQAPSFTIACQFIRSNMFVVPGTSHICLMTCCDITLQCQRLPVTLASKLGFLTAVSAETLPCIITPPPPRTPPSRVAIMFL